MGQALISQIKRISLAATRVENDPVGGHRVMRKVTPVISLVAFLFTTGFFVREAACEDMPATTPPSSQAASSWEQPAAPAPGTATAPAQARAIVATGDLAEGGTVEITELKRTSGDTVTLKFTVKNTGAEELNLGPFGEGDWYNWDLAKIYLLDLPNKKKYFVLKDSEKQPLTSRGKSKLKPGAQIALWAKFPAPPTSVGKVTVEIPTSAPFEDLPITN